MHQRIFDHQQCFKCICIFRQLVSAIITNCHYFQHLSRTFQPMFCWNKLYNPRILGQYGTDSHFNKMVRKEAQIFPIYRRWAFTMWCIFWDGIGPSVLCKLKMTLNSYHAQGTRSWNSFICAGCIANNQVLFTVLVDVLKYFVITLFDDPCIIFIMCYNRGFNFNYMMRGNTDY